MTVKEQVPQVVLDAARAVKRLCCEDESPISFAAVECLCRGDEMCDNCVVFRSIHALADWALATGECE